MTMLRDAKIAILLERNQVLIDELYQLDCKRRYDMFFSDDDAEMTTKIQNEFHENCRKLRELCEN